MVFACGGEQKKKYRNQIALSYLRIDKCHSKPKLKRNCSRAKLLNNFSNFFSYIAQDCLTFAIESKIWKKAPPLPSQHTHSFLSLKNKTQQKNVGVHCKNLPILFAKMSNDKVILARIFNNIYSNFLCCSEFLRRLNFCVYPS
ncbi:hypothetical protein BpHYR1_015677 [Brachionus plicatilis]|uniref:Uncharacterized protein n=1 Tax=Brachionus plicatilis TaxID=10195 RepID=A0A3M7S1S4_BRAPC|nr:hypothetical protein BpHYR1_015677 [Brachionus plicatilis]